MRTRHAATVAVLTAGLTASVALRRRAGRRPSAPAPAPVAHAVARPEPAGTPAVRDGVVLPFVRPVPAPPAAPVPANPARCGDTGGRTKAGAPCAARASAGGRCRHHQIAA
jgi:hypothetical protein